MTQTTDLGPALDSSGARGRRCSACAAPLTRTRGGYWLHLDPDAVRRCLEIQHEDEAEDEWLDRTTARMVD